MNICRIKKQDRYAFEYCTKLKVRDINYGGHLGNDSVASLLHEARVDVLDNMGFSELDLGNGRTGIIMADLVINYKGEGLLNDEIIVAVHIGDIDRMSLRMYYKIEKTDGTLIALAETGIVAFDYKKKAIDNFPSAFLDVLNHGDKTPSTEDEEEFICY